MNLDVPETVLEFAATARRALADDVALSRTRAAMDGDAEARRSVARAVAALGADDLDLTELHDALAAAHLCMEVGRIGGLAPVAAQLTARRAGRPGLVQAAASASRTLVDHADLADALAVVTIDGAVHEVSVHRGADPHHLLAPFASVVDPGPAVGAGATDATLWPFAETMAAFTVLGAVTAATDLSRTHLLQRHQFGKPLASFQALQHRFADCQLAVHGLYELAHYTLWALHHRPARALADALALRVAALETSRSVFRHAHQIHAAIGLCDEHALSLLSRSVQVHQYVPMPIDATVEALAVRLPTDGFDALFPIGPVGAVA